MRKAKKLIAGIMLACMFIAGTGVEPSDVYAAGTTAGSLEMKTASDSINLNAGQSFDVTFSVNAETSGFGGYLTYDNSVFTSVTVVVDGGTTSGKTDNNGEWKASYNGYTHFLSVDYYKKGCGRKYNRADCRPCESDRIIHCHTEIYIGKTGD